MSTRHSIFVHDCDLDFENKEAWQPFINRASSWWKKLDRYKTAYETKRTRMYFRSHRAYVQEIHRHLDNDRYRLTIHPLSLIAFGQDVVMMVVWTALMIMGPAQASFLFKVFLEKDNSWLWFRDLSRYLILLMSLDIVLRFFRGYVEKKTQEMVLDRKRIRRHYFKTFFFVDICTPLGWILIFVFSHYIKDGYLRFYSYLLKYILVMRIRSVIQIADMLLRKYQFHENFRTSFKLVAIAFISIHLWSCVLKLVTVRYDTFEMPNLNDSWYSKYQKDVELYQLSGRYGGSIEHMAVFRDYMIHFSVASCYYLGVEMGRYDSEDPTEMCIFSWILITGLVFYISACAKLLEFFGEINISQRKYDELMLQATQYIAEGHLPRPLRHRIFKYYSYKYNNNFFHEEIIMNGLSEHLRLEVLLYSSLHLINHLKAFRGLSRATIGSILPFLKSEIYLTGETVMRRDHPEKRFYFLLYGTCAVQLMDNREMVHCEDGDVISNAWDLVLGKRYNFFYKATAAEPCEVFMMDFEDMKYCCMYNASLMERLSSMATRCIKYIGEIYSLVTTVDEDLQGKSILHQLKRRKILIHGRHRVEKNFAMVEVTEV